MRAGYILGLLLQALSISHAGKSHLTLLKHMPYVALMQWHPLWPINLGALGGILNGDPCSLLRVIWVLPGYIGGI